MILEKKNKLNSFFKLINDELIYVILLVVIIIASVLDESFFSLRNFSNVILSAFPLIIAGYAQTIILLTAEIDLSIGGMVSLCNVVCVSLMHPESQNGFIFAILVTMLCGVICGFLNGVFIVYGRISSVITTIASGSIFSGIALALAPIPGGDMHAKFANFINGKSGFPTPIVSIILFALFLTFLTSYTPFGKRLRAIGGNVEAAYTSGVPVKKYKIISFVLAGFLCALVGIILSSQMKSYDATVGDSYSMNSISASVIGGTWFTGAVGEIKGAIAGALLLMIINNVLNLTGVSPFYQFVLQGLILILAMAISSAKTKS